MTKLLPCSILSPRSKNGHRCHGFRSALHCSSRPANRYVTNLFTRTSMRCVLCLLLLRLLLMFWGIAGGWARHYWWRRAKDWVLCWVDRWVDFYAIARWGDVCWSSKILFAAGISLFRDGSYQCVPMVSNLGSYWKKASPYVWDGWNDLVDAVLWHVSHILDPCDQVRTLRLLCCSLTRRWLGPISRCLCGLLNGTIGSFAFFQLSSRDWRLIKLIQRGYQKYHGRIYGYHKSGRSVCSDAGGFGASWNHGVRELK